MRHVGVESCHGEAGDDDRIEAGSPGKIATVYDGVMPPANLDDMAELQVTFDPSGYEEFDPGTELVLSWAGYEDLISVYKLDEIPELIPGTSITWTDTTLTYGMDHWPYLGYLYLGSEKAPG